MALCNQQFEQRLRNRCIVRLKTASFITFFDTRNRCLCLTESPRSCSNGNLYHITHVHCLLIKQNVHRPFKGGFLNKFSAGKNGYRIVCGTVDFNRENGPNESYSVIHYPMNLQTIKH